MHSEVYKTMFAHGTLSEWLDGSAVSRAQPLNRRDGGHESALLTSGSSAYFEEALLHDGSEFDGEFGDRPPDTALLCPSDECRCNRPARVKIGLVDAFTKGTKEREMATVLRSWSAHFLSSTAMALLLLLRRIPRVLS